MLLWVHKSLWWFLLLPKRCVLYLSEINCIFQLNCNMPQVDVPVCVCVLSLCTVYLYSHLIGIRISVLLPMWQRPFFSPGDLQVVRVVGDKKKKRMKWTAGNKCAGIEIEWKKVQSIGAGPWSCRQGGERRKRWKLKDRRWRQVRGTIFLPSEANERRRGNLGTGSCITQVPLKAWKW